MASKITSYPATKDPQSSEPMTSEITGSTATEEPQTETEPKRPLMPSELLNAAIEGNKSNLEQLLRLSNGQPSPHITVVFGDGAPNLLRSVTGMEDTVVHILSAYGHNILFDEICKKDRSLLKAHNARNETPFHHAARFGHIHIISELINRTKSAFREDGLKELLRQKNCLGETTLHEAARRGYGDVVSTLLGEDEELAGLVNNDSVSPLYLATARGSLDMVKNMVEKMIVNGTTRPEFYSGPKKQTALHAAVLQFPELTQELLRLYSEPPHNWADETGRTPLHFVASTGNHKIAKLLLDKDRSLAYIQDSDGSFPIHTAVRMGHVKLIVLLLQRCLDSRMGHVKLIVLLLQRCLDSGELRDINGRNFLHIAIEAKKSNVIFKLLKNSKNKLPIPDWKKMLNRMANTMDNEGNTPLHLAAEHGNVWLMLSLLKENELDLTLQNKESLTAFDLQMILLRESITNTQCRDILGELYARARGGRFSTGWFQNYTKDQMSKTDLSGGTIQDHILTRGTKESSTIVMNKAQLVGLGSVLIATVTFAAAFTLPTPPTLPEEASELQNNLNNNFKAFVLADFSAFFLSFLSTMVLIYSSSDENSDRMERNIAISKTMFAIAAKCMFLALGLCLYVQLKPDIAFRAIANIVYYFSLILFCFDNALFSILQKLMLFLRECLLLGHISDGASSVKFLSILDVKDLFLALSPIHIRTLVPFILIYILVYTTSDSRDYN